jgi:hypothetical protein
MLQRAEAKFEADIQAKYLKDDGLPNGLGRIQFLTPFESIPGQKWSSTLGFGGHFVNGKIQGTITVQEGN